MRLLRNRKNGTPKSIQTNDTPTLKIMTVCDIKDFRHKPKNKITTIYKGR
nr:MAG TPA_asm: hypothetical protein [Caudoviricetes sp.]